MTPRIPEPCRGVGGGTSGDPASGGPSLESFLAEFAEVASAPTRKLIAAYVRGQLGPLPRKSVLPMARDAGIAPRTLQELLSLHRWDEDLLVNTLQRRAWRARGRGETVGTVFETCCPKKGTRTPGLEPQPCGPSGRTRNCVLFVHLGFSDGDFNCLLGSAVYLPRGWTESPERRASTGIPGGVVYRTRQRIALDLLDRAAANGLRLGWVEFGADYASDPEFVRDVDRRGYRTLAPRTASGTDARGSGILSSWAGPPDPSSNPEALNRAARWAEECRRSFEERRRRIGLDHFAVRSYRSLLRHLALSAASMFFLAECSSNGRPREGDAGPQSPGR